MRLGRVSLIRLAVFGVIAFAMVRPAFARDFRPHTGYVDSTLAERGDPSADLQLIEPLPYDGPSFRERIFNEQLSHEFQEQYNQKFGRTDAERIFASPNRTSYYNDIWFRGSPEEYSEERRKFADYMMKRLVEYHTDDFMKNNPRGRAIYELKETVSNVQVKVQSFQFDLRYDIAGNTADFLIKNPYLNTAKIRLQMNPGAFGPFASIDETIFTIGTQVTRTISFESYFTMPLNNLSLVARKALMPALQGTLSLVDAQRDLGPDTYRTVEHQWIRENIYLAGLNYSF